MTWNNSNLTQPNQSAKDIELLLQGKADRLTLPAQKIFLHAGEPLDAIYYICKGRTNHYIIAADGTEKLLYSLTSGWFFGEVPHFLHLPTGLMSKTKEKTTFYKIHFDLYEELFDTNRLFRQIVLQSYSRKMLIMRHEIENLSANSCKKRLKQLFYTTADVSQLVDGAWYNLSIHYTHYELSVIVGASRVTVSKIINELYKENFLRSLNRKNQISATEYKKYGESLASTSM